jgi:phosphoribosylanthranilate isomerase
MTNNPKIKICGVKDIKISKLLLDLNIDYIGLNFIKKSSRFITIEKARSITDEITQYQKTINSKINTVGLFQNHEVEYVNSIIKCLNLDYVQLCGSEDYNYAKKINSQIIKMIYIKNDEKEEVIKSQIQSSLQYADFIILDTFSISSKGGTGKSFNWEKFKNLFNEKIFIAGGLNPDNINIVNKKYSPWGVDVATGVEINKIKDVSKIKVFVENLNSK